MSSSDDNHRNTNMSSLLPDDAEQPPLVLDEQLVVLIHQIYANASSFTEMQDFVHEFVKASGAKAVDIVTTDDSSERIFIEQPDGNEICLSYNEIAGVRIYRPIYRNSNSHMGASAAQHVECEINPPNRAEMLLHFGLPKRDREYMIGDLEEEFRDVILPKYGPRVAARWYWWQAVRSVVAASGGRVRIWLSFGGLARAAGWIVEKFTL